MAPPICYKESVFSIVTTVSQVLGRFVMEIVSIRIKSNGAFQMRGIVPRLDQLRFSFHRWYSLWSIFACTLESCWAILPAGAHQSRTNLI